MLLLSIILITYVSAFGQSAIIVNRGKNITSETFDFQEAMENNIINMKIEFIEGANKDNTVGIFDGDYYSEVDIKK